MKIFFALGNNFVLIRPTTYSYGTVEEGRVVIKDNVFEITEQIVEIFETNDPLTLEPGCIALSINGSVFFHPFSNETGELTKLSYSIPDPKLISFFPDQITARINNSKLVICDSEQTVILEKDIPMDSMFACVSPLQAILISPIENFMLLITYNSPDDVSIEELPGGFANLSCAAIFDEKSFVFSRDDSTLYLYSHEDNSLKSISVESKIKRIVAAELDTFESTCFCLTTDKKVLCVRFDSKTVTEVATNIIDFCVIKNPFDIVVGTKANGEIIVLNGKGNKPLQPSIHSMVDALNSRVATSLSNIAQTRERLNFRNTLASSDTFELPPMITLFGEEPKEKKGDEDESEEKESQKFWIENVSGCISFEIHSNLPIPPDSSVFVSSGVAAFESRISMEQNDLNCITIDFSVNVESISAVEHFQVFLKNESKIYFAGEIIIPIDVLLSSNEIPRIEKSYNVAFTRKSFTCLSPAMKSMSQSSQGKNQKNQNKLQINEIDGGVNIRISADTCEHFAQRLISASSLVPEGATFIQLDDQKKQLQVAHDLARSVSMFTQINENDSLEKSLLLTLKSDIDEYMAAINM